MLGSIIGDIVGSIYEFDNVKTKSFEFFQDHMEFTDDSILSIATAEWLLNGGDVSSYYYRYAQKYPNPMGSYGTMFWQWVHRANRGIKEPYNSYGNGSAMRAGATGWTANTMDETMEIAKISAECTHNHPEGIKGAQATAACIYTARQGESKDNIKTLIRKMFDYDLTMSIEELQRRYSWMGIDGKGNGATCQDSVPQAIICALEATDFEDAVRNAISIGGDSDTIGCITGGIAEALYGIPHNIYNKGMTYLTQELQDIVKAFELKYGNNIKPL